MDTYGFVVSMIALCVLSAYAARGITILEMVMTTISLIVGSWLLFIVALELPFRMFPWSY